MQKCRRCTSATAIKDGSKSGLGLVCASRSEAIFFDRTSKEGGTLHFWTGDIPATIKKSSSKKVLPDETKTISLCMSLSARSCEDIRDLSKIDKTEMGKVTRIKRCKTPYLDGKHRSALPRLKVSSDKKPKPSTDSCRPLKICVSPGGYFSDSSKASDQSKVPLHKLHFGTRFPVRLRVRTPTKVSPWQNKQSLVSPQCKKTRTKLYAEHISPVKLVGNQTPKNCCCVSFSISPDEVLFHSNLSLSSALQEDCSKKGTGIPHRCRGYENLVEADTNFKSKKGSDKKQLLYKRGSKELKTTSSRNLSSADQGGSKRKYRIKSSHKNRRRNYSKDDITSDRAKGDACQALKVYDSYAVGKQLEIARSKMITFRNILNPEHPVRDIIHDTAVVLLRTKKRVKKPKKGIHKADKKPRSKSFSNSMLQGRKQKPSIEHMSKRHRFPMLAHSSLTWSSSSALKPSLLDSSTAQGHTSVTKELLPLRTNIKKLKLRQKTPARDRKSNTVDKPCINLKPPNSCNVKGQNHRATRPAPKPRVKEKASINRGSWLSSPAWHTKMMNRTPDTSLYCYRNRQQHKRSPERQSSNPFTNTRLPNSEIHKAASCNTKLESPEFSNSEQLDGHSSGKSCWRRYKKAAESISSFYTKFSSCKEKCSCSGAMRRAQVGLVQGTLRLPAAAMSCNEQKLNIFLQHSAKDNDKKHINAHNINASHSRTNHSQSSCCIVTVVPSFYSFLKCIDNTVAVPTTCYDGLPKACYDDLPKACYDDLPKACCGDSPKTSKMFAGKSNILLSTNPQMDRSQSSEEASSNAERNISLIENNFTETLSVVTATDGSRACHAEKELELSYEVKQPLLMNTREVSQEPKKIVWPTSKENSLTKAKEAYCDTGVKLNARRHTSYTSSSVTAAKSILRTGSISGRHNLQQFARTNVTAKLHTECKKLHSKHNNGLKRELHFDCSHCSKHIPSTGHVCVRKTAHIVIMFVLLLIVVSAQVLVFFFL